MTASLEPQEVRYKSYHFHHLVDRRYEAMFLKLAFPIIIGPEGHRDCLALGPI